MAAILSRPQWVNWRNWPIQNRIKTQRFTMYYTSQAVKWPPYICKHCRITYGWSFIFPGNDTQSNMNDITMKLESYWQKSMRFWQSCLLLRKANHKFICRRFYAALTGDSMLLHPFWNNAVDIHVIVVWNLYEIYGRSLLIKWKKRFHQISLKPNERLWKHYFRIVYCEINQVLPLCYNILSFRTCPVPALISLKQ